MSDTKKYLVGMFDDDDVLLHAIKNIRKQGYKITDCFTPFPVHGIEHAMDVEPTRLHTAGFFFGATGLTVALSMITFVNYFNYPTIFGGKPYWGLMAYVPIIFEHTVLFAAIGMVVSFYYLCKLYPGKKPTIIDERTTDHMFALTFEIDGSQDTNAISDLLKNEGAVEVYQKEI
ncbi:MAG: DUF3341 domain-containing protein [Sphingobacteriales bacterium]|jgi:hypothetical protein|nr:MAG: DUF3341 domain-containing protein [Sphingobacteriales bacterium]